MGTIDRLLKELISAALDCSLSGLGKLFVMEAFNTMELCGPTV